jgi:outer membrane protein TolC
MRKVTRWRKWMGAAALLAGVGILGGCTRPLYMTPETQQLAASVQMPPDLETNPAASAIPDWSDHKPPPTVLDANREPRYMTLQEAMAIALERGSRGNASSFIFQNFQISGGNALAGGFSASFNDDLVTFAGRGIQGDDAIRAFALDPAIVAADVEGALAKFDARFVGSMSWQKRDQAVANVFNNFNNGDFAAAEAGLIKPLPTGGVAGITFDTNYSRLGAVPQGFSVINPSYTPSLTLAIEQPLLRDYGVDINQLNPTHPGSITGLFPNYRPTGGRAEGILVTRLRADQAKAEFERDVTFLVFNVELAYWSLYGRYYSKYAADIALRQAYVTWEQLLELQRAGLQTKQGVAQARAQFEDFRLQYLVALQNVLEAERRLRGILGLPLEDGKRIVPADRAVLAPYKPDWQTSLAEALANRPELRMARQELKVQQLNVMLQENNVRPDLRLGANYNVQGIGTRIDGRGPTTTFDASGNQTNVPGNAFSSLTDNKFGSWQVLLRADIPIGYRDARANLRVAQLNLARSHIVLKNQEKKAELFLGSMYQQLDAYYEQIVLQQARRVALGTQLQGQFERVKIGKDPLIQLLDAQRAFSGSIEAEADALVSYNIVIAGYHLAKGTILQFNNITIGDGPLPAAIGERAADHFAARQAGLKVRERPALQPVGAAGAACPSPAVPPAGPLPEALGMPKVDPNAPPPVGLPGTPMTIPPPTAPKDLPKDMPKDGKPPESKPLTVPVPLPGAVTPPEVSTGPTLPVSGSDGGDVPAMPSTPVSRYRPK